MRASIRRILLLGLLVLLATTGWAAEQPSLSGRVVELALTGPVGPASSDYLLRALEQADHGDAALVVLRIDTPGGLDSSMRDIVQAILASRVPVVGFVSPSGARAASAGTYILYACHLAAMAPGTNLGAATPVAIGPGGTPPGEPAKPEPSDGATADGSRPPAPADTLARKSQNDAVAYLRALAELRGRNADWAERAVREAASLSAQAAMTAGVIEVVASDLPDLLRQIDGRRVAVGGGLATVDVQGREVVPLLPDWRTRLLAVITNPNVAYLLMLVGVYGLILEFYNPGIGVAGVAGGICLLLALFAFQALPVNYAGMALLVLGVVLLVGEAVMPSFGALGIGGVIAFVLGSILLLDRDIPEFRIAWGLILGVGLGSAVGVALLAAFAVRATHRAVTTGAEAILTDCGEAIADFVNGRGPIRLQGEIWQAQCDRPVSAGDAVRVVERRGLIVKVEPMAKDLGWNQGVKP
ncbi:NfeD family protein [Candidatus Macondimonas diazotrophica]|uniref:NfeD family protein n=1 Tax=Candidatus Macondimonas diazotrophica TaxID=2305248 RepID=UPI001F0D86C2|nr:nodulation protein NfeD [Candidatus Macondimonas diazotrophica]